MHSNQPAIYARIEKRIQPFYLFLLLWSATFVIYLPAMRAGWVTDTVDWQEKVQNMNFWDYLNLTQTRVPSLYQFTQLLTWLLYQVMGSNHYAWHLFNVTLQSANAVLIFVVFTTIATDGGLANNKLIGAAAALLFCVCPHLSETMVWKASFHYLAAFFIMLIILRLLLLFLHTPRVRYAIVAGILFALSAFSLEIFYLTPWLALVIIIFYSQIGDFDWGVIRKALLSFFVPTLLLFVMHLVLLRYITGFYTSHLGTDMVQPVVNYLRKPPIYFFHIVFLGRFFHDGVRHFVYDLCENVKFLGLFYSLIFVAGVFIVLRFRQMGAKGRMVSLLFVCTLMCLVIVCPVWVAGSQIVSFDRYAYMVLPFVYLLLCTLVFGNRVHFVSIGIIFMYLLTNARFTLRANNYWRKSNNVMERLISTFPKVPEGKTVLLLNLPDNMDGVPMISALRSGAFKQLYNVNSAQKINSPVYDVLSHNINTPDDGVHVRVVSDSVVHVTLNQWGTWWWYSFRGGVSYENEVYKMDILPGGHSYGITLKNAPANCLMLYNVGGNWKEVNMSIRDKDQD